MPGRTRTLVRELNGGLGDLGTLLPYVIGAVSVAGLAPIGILLGFGVSLIAAGLFYGLPMAVQPMKVMGALIITGEFTPGMVAASGLLIGAVMLVLGLTGAASRLTRVVAPSIIMGMQVGLGLTMAWSGLGLMANRWWLGATVLLLLVVLLRRTRLPAVLLAVAGTAALGLALGWTSWPQPRVQPWLADLSFVWPTWSEMRWAFWHSVLPQLPMTVANAVVMTAALAAALYPQRAARASPRNLCLSTGLANLLLAPLGALPMCHGAGGLQAQHRYGASTGWAPVLLGGCLLLLVALSGADAIQWLALIPLSAVGALLCLAGMDLALSRRLFEARRACWPVIGTVALLTVLVNPAVALATGWGLEWLRGWRVRRLAK